MLQIQHIKKQYGAGDTVQIALNDVSLNLREHELVAILGPSGSGKSTLLNVIGGLDQYDSGDLIINGVSTKKYKDRDWDSYRNHTVGFIFQSYNLIPHQNVLSNVELALTISGVSRSGRKKRAIEALQAVGLGSQLHKKPNQMSGGQMQRVAIARALVNNPSIVLADEPTGALDSETSIQVMELLKQVSKDRLVVMVTHNPELAEKYADRIVRVKDGRLIDDTDPYEVDEAAQLPPEHKNMGRSSMSFLSALSLSFQNLRSKKARTLMTAFAGSIGIIGIAVIMALSTGFQHYVDQVQEETLSNNPLVLQADTADLSALMMPGKRNDAQEDAGSTCITEDQALASVFEHIGSNNLGEFQDHLEAHWEEVSPYLTAVQQNYGLRPRIYAADPTQTRQVNPGCIFRDLTGDPVASALLDGDVFQELLNNPKQLQEQYRLLDGRWPEDYHELVFVLPSPHQLSDQVAYTIGLKDLDSLDHMIGQLMDGEDISVEAEPMQWDYDDLLALTFKLVCVPDLYQYNPQYEIWEDMSGDPHYLSSVIEQGEELRVVGIICPQEDGNASFLTPGIAYLPELTQHLMAVTAEAPIVQQQLEKPDYDVFSGKAFKSDEGALDFSFEDLITVDGDAISNAFGMDMNEENLNAMLQARLNDMIASMQVDTTGAQRDFTRVLTAMCEEMLTDYAYTHAEPDGTVKVYLLDAEPTVTAYLNSPSAQVQLERLAYTYQVPASSFYQVYHPLMVGFLTDYVSRNLEMAPILPEPEIPEVPVEPEIPDVPEVPAEPEIPETPEQTEPSEGTLLPEEPGGANDLPLPESEVPAAEEALPESEPITEDVFTLEPLSFYSEDDTAVYETPSFDLPLDEEFYEDPAESGDNVDPFFSQPEVSVEPWDLYANLDVSQISNIAWDFSGSPVVSGAASVMSKKMMQATILENVVSEAAGLGNEFADMLGNSFYVNEDQLSGAIQFNMNEDELKRIISTMSSQNQERSAETNLKLLGYADPRQPASISFYLSDFAGKEAFLAFLDQYNDDQIQAGHEEKAIRYTDMAGAMMTSIRTMIDSVSYVLIAFVAISLLVSSIMIGIITYISVMERTKEIGVLRAMGASKRNISQVFNAETFIIGLFSGLLGIGITLLLLIPGNHLLHNLIGSADITARLPLISAVILVVLSMLLTLMGGLIPSRQASKKDPVVALRSE